MKLKLLSLGALALCASAASHAAVSTTDVANHFVDALEHHHYKEAAAMFAPGSVESTASTERTLQRIDSSLGGWSTLHSVATLPDGKSVKLEVAAQPHASLSGQKFVQLRYASTASDGQAVFYEMNLTPDGMPPQILSFGLHFPAADAQSSQRANQLVGEINR